MSGHLLISRRTVLRGLGTSMALPLLDAMRPAPALAAQAAVGAAGSGTPRRMAFLFVPNGANMDKWVPNRVGYDYDLPYILEPAARIKDDLLVMSGLTHDKGRANGDGAGDHARCASVFLTGAQPRKTAGANIRSGVSVDQVAARKIGRATPFPSLELGIEGGRNAGNCDSGYSCAYSSNVSWAGPSTPVGKEINPRLVFERLFSNQKSKDGAESRFERDAYQRSILDFVREDAQRLQSRLGQSDRLKLDEYLTGVREIERRLSRDDTGRAGRDADNFPKPAGVPEEYAEHVRLMCDMMVLAFQADLTRVATCMFGNAGSNRPYRNIGVSDGHHDLSHHGNDQAKLDKIAEINRFHVSQFAYFVERLRSIPEAGGTLLDNCMIVYGSGISDGNRHNNENLPIMMAGRGGGTITPGRHVSFPYETPLCNLFVSLLDRMGAAVPWHGDSTGRLTGLEA
ncbi:MAG: DUF1552 domain-containing protein [Pirellulales bacterium]